MEGPQRELRTPRAAGVAGLLFCILFVLALLLLQAKPPTGANAEGIVAWYRQRVSGSSTLIGLYLIPFAGIAFLWFIAVVRSRIGEREDRFFSTVFLGSGLLFVAMVFAAAAVSASLVAGARFQAALAPTAATILSTRSLAYSLLFVYAIRMAGVFMIATSSIALRTTAFPRWIAVTGYVIAAILLLSVRFYDLLILLFPAWVAVVSVEVLVRARSQR
jgi:hypothetical protein